MSLPAGRERRRRDLYGRLRRVAYGLLLAAASPGAIAADELAAVGRYGASLREGLRVNLTVKDVGQLHLKVSRSPELRLELTDSPGGLHPVEAAVKYDHGGGGDPGEKVAQVTMKWRF
jgi:hypothetical protein